MGTNGRQWDTMAFHGLTKPFQSEGNREFPLPRHGRNDGFSNSGLLGAWISAVLCPGQGGFWAFSDRSARAGRTAARTGREEKKKRKARRPVSRVLSLPKQEMAIHLGRPLPDASRDLPGRRRGNPPAGINPACRPYLVLLPVGFALPPPLPGARCALTAPFHPYPPSPKASEGGLLSVALSLGSPPPAVNRHRVSVEPGLSSPRGFPRCER